MKTVLCYGDSNTYGADSACRGHRLDYDVRWPGRLQMELGNAYRVIEEGMGGRTTVLEDPFEPYRNGRTALPPCLESHKPLDLVVIMLGTNDLKLRFGVPAYDVAIGVKSLVQMIRHYECGTTEKPGVPGGSPEILIVSPAYVGVNIEQSCFGEMFGIQSVEKSHQLARWMKAVAEETGCHFLDAAPLACCGPDNLHINPEGHAALACAIAKMVREILG